MLLFYVSSPRQLLWKKRPHTGRNGPLPFVLQKFDKQKRHVQTFLTFTRVFPVLFYIALFARAIRPAS